MNKKPLLILAFAIIFILAFSSIASADGEFVKGLNKNMELYPNWIVNEETQPIFTYSQAITELVYVEVPCDTDRDGLRDRITVWIMRPRTTDGFLCPVMLEHSPYHNGTVGFSRVSGTAFNGAYDYMREPFRSWDNWPIHKDLSDPAYADTTNKTYDDVRYKGMEAHEWPWIDGAFTTGSWYTGTNYGNVPAATVSAKDPFTGETIYGQPTSPYNWPQAPGTFYRYYLPRGYALVYGQLLGNRDSDGITQTLRQEEVLSAMAVIKWLNGEAKGFTTRRGNIETKADWANGHVAMTGTSYPADISFATVVTGVKGLKAVMPQCNGLNWYDYYRYAGSVNAPGGYGGEDLNLHASFNFSRFNADVTSGVPPANGTWFGKDIQDVFFETQKRMMVDCDRLTGDYSTEWEFRNFGRLVDNINEDVGLFLTTGFMDWNSQPKLSMANWTVLTEKCPGTYKELATISSHASQASVVIHGKSIVEWFHLWMDHFLLGLDNGVVEALPDLTVINTKTGAVEGYNVNKNAQPGDDDYLIPGGIIPGAKNQKIYMVPGQGGKAGRLSYNAPPATVEHFDDMNVLDMLEATYPGAPTLTAVQKTIRISSDGNYIVTTGSGTTSQSQFCEGRAVGFNRTYNFGITATTPEAIQSINEQIFAAADKPIEGRLMYLSEPLKEDVRYSGTGVIHLMAAPNRGSGTISAALVEIGRNRNMESSRADAWGNSVGTGNNLLQQAYALQLGGGQGTMNVGTYRNPSAVGTFMNYKYVTVGYADVQNPNYSGKVWFEAPEQNYIPDFYFQTTKIVPGTYYPYTVELDPYDYVFNAGSQIGLMIFGTDPDYTQLYDECCIPSFDIKIAESYAMLPMKLAEPSKPVTIEAGSSLVELGDTVDITYSIKGNDLGFATLNLELPFDSSLCTPVTVTPAGLLDGAVLKYTIEAGLLKVNIAAEDNVPGDGALFTVTYLVKETAPRVFNTPLNVKVIDAKFGSLIDKTVDLDVIIKAGALKTYDYTVYFVADKAKLVVGDTVTVDVMLAGDKNYTQVATEITFDASQLEYLGYSNLTGWAAAVTRPTPNIIAVRSVSGTNMVTGMPCWPAQRIVTLKFKATGAFTGDSLAASPTFASTLVSPAGGVTGALTAPGKPADITWHKIGNEFLQANLAKFPNMWNFATNQINPIFSNNNVINEVVWIEAPLDTDFDGKRDLMRVVIRRPVETLPENGGLKSPALINISPYVTTTSSGVLFIGFSDRIYDGFPQQGPAATRFQHTAFSRRPAGVAGALADRSHWGKIYGPDNDKSYKALRDVTERRVGRGAESTCATYKELLADGMLNASVYTPEQAANYPWLPPARIPVSSQRDGAPFATAPGSAGPWSAANMIPRGYAMLQYRITGSDNAEGFLQYGMYQECLAGAAVVDWLNGRVRGYADPNGLVEVKAYWATGEAAASGTSYEGTMPMAAAVTGVEGLKTIFPGAPVTNAYNYYRENGMPYAPGGYVGEDLNAITMYCSGRMVNTASPTYPTPITSSTWDTFWDWLLYLTSEQDATTGDYSPAWDERNPLSFGADFRQDLGVIMGHGFNDGNVKFRHTALLNETLKHYGVDVIKGLFHQGGHGMGNTRTGAWTTTAVMTEWADHYLYGLANGIVERTPNYSIESNTLGAAAGTWRNYDTWPRGDVYQNFYPTGGRVGAISTVAPSTTTSVTFQDDYLTRVTYPQTYDDAYYTNNVANLAANRQHLRANGLNSANGALANLLIVRGQGANSALGSSQRPIWRNMLMGGLEGVTTAWSGTEQRLLYTSSALTAQFSKTKELKDRILFLTNIEKDFTISGFTKMTAEIAASKDVGTISVMLLEWGAANVKIVAMGSIDVRNPNPDGTIAPDVPGLANLAKGGNWHANYLFQPVDIVPYGTSAPTAANFNSYTWEMDVTEYKFTAGNQMGLILYGSDPDFTYITRDATEFTVNLGPNTYVSLPVVGGPIAAPAPVMAVPGFEEELENEEPVLDEVDDVVEDVVDE